MITKEVKIVIAFILGGCLFIGMVLFLVFNLTPKIVHQEKYSIEYVLVDIEPPKRFYVTVQLPDLRISRIYVSKRCSNWRKNKIGDKVTLVVNKNTYDDGIIRYDYDSKTLKSTFCD